VSQPTRSRLIAKWCFVATLYLKRESSRLAAWTGLGRTGTIIIAALAGGALAATFSVLAGGQVDSMWGSMLLGFVLTATLLTCLVLLPAPGGPEVYFAAQRHEFQQLRQQYAALRQQLKAEQEAARQQALQAPTQESPRTNAGAMTSPQAPYSPPRNH
jgi:hypothetical protein